MRFLNGALALALVIGLFPSPASAQPAEGGDCRRAAEKAAIRKHKRMFPDAEGGLRNIQMKSVAPATLIGEGSTQMELEVWAISGTDEVDSVLFLATMERALDSSGRLKCRNRGVLQLF